MEHSVLHFISLSNPSPQCSWNPLGRECGKSVRANGIENTRRKHPYKSIEQGSHELTETEKLSTGSEQGPLYISYGFTLSILLES